MLHILTAVIGYFCIPCIQALFMHTYTCHTSKNCIATAFSIVYYMNTWQMQEVILFFFCIQTPFMHNIQCIYYRNSVSTVLVYCSRYNGSVLLYTADFGKCRLFRFCMHTSPLHAQYTYCILQKQCKLYVSMLF